MESLDEYDRDLKGARAKVANEGESSCPQVDHMVGAKTTPLAVGQDPYLDDSIEKCENSNWMEDNQGPSFSKVFEGANSDVLRPPSVADSNSVNDFHMVELFFDFQTNACMLPS